MTRARRPRLVLIDPGLEPTTPGAGSSHAARYVLPLLAAAGDRSGVLVGRRGFRGACPLPVDCLVHDTLLHGTHAKVTAAGELDRLDDRGRWRWKLEPPWAAWHSRRRRAERIAAFAAGVLPALAELQPGDVVFVSTASELEVMGLARAIARVAPPRGIGWHVQFHTPLERGFAADRPRQARRLERIRRLLTTAHAVAAPHPLHLHATTPELAAEYRRLDAGDCDVLPYPISVGVGPLPARTASGPLRLAALGDARPEKNTHRLLEVVEAVQGDPLLAGAVHFVVQRNLGFPPDSTAAEHEAVRRCLAGLARRQGVDLLDGPLAEDRYAHHLASADVALLPYDQGRYRTRLSAILLETMAAGGVPIVSGGGWMARQLEELLRQHVERVVAASAGAEPVPLAALAAPTIGRAGLPVAITLPARTTAVLVDIDWPIAGDAALAEPPLRVSFAEAEQASATVVTAPTTTGPGRTLFPCPPAATSRPARLLLRPAVGADRVALDRVCVRGLTGAAAPPAGAGGVVVDTATDLPAAIAEVVRHADHYRRTARAAAEIVRRFHSPAAVVARLTP